VAFAFAGCVSVDEDALNARKALQSGKTSEAVTWAEELANESHYSRNLGAVEAGRVQMLAGNHVAAEKWFRTAVDSALDRKEAQPKIKLGDVGNTLLSATITDDRTREYYLAPYELNLALEYAILTQAFNGRRNDALVDARLAVYVQDNLAETYGADLKKSADSGDAQASTAADSVYRDQSAALKEMMAATRNSWENPTLWWLTGLLFEADGEKAMAWQSYRKAAAVRADNPVFAAAAARAERDAVTPARGLAKLVVLYEDGFVPLRESLKIPVPIYTGMSIDIPMYKSGAYAPAHVAISGAEKLVAAVPTLDVRALAARDLDEHLPGVILRNITRAAVQAGAQAAVNANGNQYAKVAVFVGNAVVSAIRKADTRSWTTLPDGQQVWCEDAMKPGDYGIGCSVNGATVQVPVTLRAGETKLLWIVGGVGGFRTAQATL